MFVYLLGIGAAVIFYMILTYNGLVRKRAQLEEGWSGISVQLKRRYDLVPNLVNTVKGYATHEQEVFREVTEARNKSTTVTSVHDVSSAESALSMGLGRLLAVAENYPDLKANTNFLDLQNELSSIENSLQNARRYYNGTVRDYEIMRESFPSNLIANNFGFKEREFFELSDPKIESATPEVKF